MKLIGKPFIRVMVFIAVSLFIHFSADQVLYAGFPIAISENVALQFREIVTVLNDIKKNSHGEFSCFENSPVRVSEIFKKPAFREYRAVIATSSELNNTLIPQNPEYIIEDGRALDIEFYLVGRAAESLLKILGPAVIHPGEESVMNFYRDIIEGCMYKRCLSNSNDWPMRKFRKQDLSTDIMEKCDIIILKYVANTKLLVGKELMSEVKRHTDMTYMPVNLFDTTDAQEPEGLKQCMHKFSDNHAVEDKALYSFREYPDLTRFSEATGIKIDDITDRLDPSWRIQTVAMNERIKIIYPALSRNYVEKFRKYLYKRLRAITAAFAVDPKDSELKYLREDYANSYYLLNADFGGIIAVADIIYLDAKSEYDLVDNLFGFRALREKVWRKNALKDAEVSEIKKVEKKFSEYFKRRSELPGERVDLNLLWAKIRTTDLRYLLHQHYYNLGKGSLKLSSLYLKSTRKILESLGNDINTVEASDDDFYVKLRKTDKFDDVLGKYRIRAKQIPGIP